MANLTSIGLTAGAGSSGTGTISTLDNVIGTAGTPSVPVLTVQGVASGTAQPVSAASLPLPTGAATAAKQPALGTAGSASTDVITVQGIASGTAQPVTLTSTTITGNVSSNLQLAGTAVTAGAGATAAGTPRITLASDSPGIITTGSQASPSSSYISSVVAGDIAAAATDSGNPVKIGGVGKTANPTAVTDGQRANALFDKLGKQVVVGAIRDLKGQQATTITASTSETTIVTAVASTFLDLYGLTLTNSSATATTVTIKDSTAGTTRFSIVVPAGDTRGFMLSVDSAVPQATVNTAWTATSSQSITSLFVTALFVKNI